VSDAELGIDLRRLIELIGMAGKDDTIKLDLDEHTHKLRISMGGLEYTMALIDPVSMRKSPNVPELDLPAEIKVSSNKFKQMVKAAGMVGDNMTIGIDEETVYMEAKGDSDAVRLDITEGDLVSLKSAHVSGTYSLDYLNDMSKGIGAASEMTINLGRDLPMVIDFSPYPRCDVIYLLAPRIEPE
jgi:proliferating cell nuclear antigen